MEAIVEYLPPLKEVPRIKLKGELDIYTVPTLKQTVQALMEEGHNTVILDLSEAVYIDSTGLGTLVGIYRRAREKAGKVYLICPNAQIRKLFKTTGLSQLFSFFASEEEFQKELQNA